MRSRRGSWAQQLVLSLALLTSSCVGQVDWDCASCKCIWASGKRTAECKRLNLTEIPTTLSMEIQHLDLTGNYITHLPDKVFSRVSLVNLQKLVLRECNIKAVNAEAFSGLRIVIEIDLSSNRIRQLHRGTFDETERLRVLLLNKNRLEKLEDELFHDLHYLQKVELSDNHLLRVGQTSFRNLPDLLTLTFDGNRLEHLDLRSFEGLPKLGSLELRKNPWHCDCRLKPFRDWAIQRKLYTRPTSCERPAVLAQRTWDEVDSDEFACAPRIESIGAVQLGEAGSGRAQLWCRAQAQPRARIAWVHRQRVLGNGTKRHASDRSYLLRLSDDWANLTIPELQLSDRGEYVCVAKNFGGSAERNVSLLVPGDASGNREAGVGLPLALGLGLVALLFLLLALALCLCYCRRRRSRHDEKSAEAASLDQHGLGEQEKSLITAINPVVKPPRRYEAPSLAPHGGGGGGGGTEMTELNRTLLDNESVFGQYSISSTTSDQVICTTTPLRGSYQERTRIFPADGVGSVVGVLPNGLSAGEEGCGRATPELEVAVSRCVGPLQRSSSQVGSLSLQSRGPYPRHHQQYPPDLLAFSAGRNGSPTSSQASTAPDGSRLPAHQSLSPYLAASPSSPAATSLVVAAAFAGPAGFKTLPHPARASSATPYSLGHQHPSVARHHHGYGTIPRRPRAPSWSSCPPTSPTEREIAEPVYDNLGLRTTADGSSVLSLNKSPEPGMSMRGRPLPATPGSPSPLTNGQLTLPRAPRGPPALQLNRSAPEGAPERALDLVAEHQQSGEALPSPSARKVPPRPPPKPKKKSPNGPLYEDEGEDGTEV